MQVPRVDARIAAESTAKPSVITHFQKGGATQLSKRPPGRKKGKEKAGEKRKMEGHPVGYKPCDSETKARQTEKHCRGDYLSSLDSK